MGEVELMELTTKFKKACRYIDNVSIPVSERQRHLPKFEMLIAGINAAHLNSQEMRRFLQ